jgi:hydrogenase maturation protease
LRTRVIGVGNPLRGDDAAGLLVARRVRELAGAEMEVVELEGEPARLLDAWEGAELALVVDAVSSGGVPGETMRFDVSEEPLPRAATAASTHALGLRDVVELGRALGRLPARLIIFGIEGAGFETGAPPSAAVMSAADVVAEAIVAGAARR